MQIDITRALFQGREAAPTLGLSLKEVLPKGSAACCDERPRTVRTGPKMSHVMTLIERDAKGGPLFKMGYTACGDPVIEYKGSVATIGGGILYLSDLTDEYRAGRMAVWISFLAFARKMLGEADEETAASFKDYRKWIEEGMEPGDPSLRTAVGKLCDKYYYQYAKNLEGPLNVYPLPDPADAGMMSTFTFRDEGWHRPERCKESPRPVMTAAQETKEHDGFDAAAFMGDVWSGKYRIPYEWPEEMKHRIPSLEGFTDFVPSRLTARILMKIHYRACIVLKRMEKIGEGMKEPSGRRMALGHDDVNILITGTPGSGKTYTIQFICAALGMPCFVQAINKDTEEGELTEKVTFVEEKLRSVMTDCLRCAENGGALVLEEVNLGMANVLQGVLGQFVEYPFIMQKADRKILRHPLCVVFATMNPRTEGTMPLNEAFVSRMRHPYRMEEPGEKEFISILSARTGEGEGLCASVYKTYKSVRDTIETYRNDIDSLDTDSVLQSLSIRACCAAIEDIQEGCSMEEAVESTIIGIIAVHNEEMADRVSRSLKMMR